MLFMKLRRNMKKNTILFTITILLLGCYSSYDYRITKLEKQSFKYDELPDEIKFFIGNPSEYKSIKSEYNNSTSIFCLDESCNYSVRSKETGPWIDYSILTDNNKKITYRVEREIPTPYIIFQNKLYFMTEYNLLRSIKNEEVIFDERIYTTSFTCYELK